MNISRRSALSSLAILATLPLVAPGRALAAPSMRIGVIGAGWLGGTVGRQWVRSGHQVMFSSRHPEELRPMAQELGSLASVGTPREAAEFGSVLLFAVPYDAIPQLGTDLSTFLIGKIVLDACNPPAGGNALAEEALRNGVGLTSAKYLQGSKLVRAFSAVDASAVEASAARRTGKLGVPLASDDPQALQIAATLVVDAGCEPVIVGNLAAGRSFQRGGPGFRANTTAAALRQALGMPSD